MAFFLEERNTKFLTDNETPLIGPGQYHHPSKFDARPSKDNPQVPFGQSTTRCDVNTSGNFNPAPGQYN